MKKTILLLAVICFAATAFCQNETSVYDSSFQALYKAIALHPWHRNSRGTIFDSVVKRWDKDIRIYVEGGPSKTRKEITAKLKNTIAHISPAIDNKIKISFADDKSSANYLVRITEVGTSGWYIKWDALFNIYSCTTLINTKAIFNEEERMGLVSQYFLQSLGDFIFNDKDRSFLRDNSTVASNMTVWRQDVNAIDLQILKLHYSDDLKSGMAKKDIDQYFVSHGN